MADDPESKGNALVQISDLFGLSKSADRLVAAIVRGVGNLLAPGQKNGKRKPILLRLKIGTERFRKRAYQLDQLI